MSEILAKSHTSFYNKFRPKHWDEIIGQEAIIQLLRGLVIRGNVKSVNSYVFTAGPGSGKTTTARVFAKAVNCQHEDKHKHPCNKCDF